MSELGDLLELMHGATGRYASLRATIREWTHLERTGQAVERHMQALEAGGRGNRMVSYGYPGSDELQPEVHETVMKLWLASPETWRLERHGGQVEEQLVVTDGEHCWSYSPSYGAIVNPAGGATYGFEHLTDPSLLLGRLDLEPMGRTTIAGRDAVHVRATDRHREWHSPGGLPEWATHHELDVDFERGVLLRCGSFFDGEEFLTYEVTEVAFDETFPADTFVFAPPPGEEILDPEAAFPHGQEMTIEEAARLADFTVLIPRRIPEGAELRVHYSPGWARNDQPPMVWLNYWFESARHSLAFGQSGDDRHLLSSLSWEQLEHDGQELRVSDQHGQRLLALERAGTYVVVQSDLDRETLIEIALSLEPAPMEPPRLVDG
jgi:outer membrane lipoprotein-sorting protein